MFSLDISAVTGKAHVRYLRDHVARARKMIESPLRELSLALVGDRKMADLHQQFMNIAGPTDVLTFELEHDERGRAVAGEVILCVPYAMRQAKKTVVPVRKELLLYAIHGMLHLCGFDDRTQRDFAQMHEREDDILKKLGVGAVFYSGRESRVRGMNQLKNSEHRTSNVQLSTSNGKRTLEVERSTLKVRRSEFNSSKMGVVPKRRAKKGGSR
jgi:rRNA maturation RNase YbeY